MGYAGYTPAKLPPAMPTPLEAALQLVASLEALEIIGKLVYNCAVSPKEDKYRTIKLSNKAISEKVASAEGAVDALIALGWAPAEQEGGEPQLVIPQGRFLTMAEFRVVEAAKERLRKRMEEQKKNAVRSSSSNNLRALPVAA